MINVHSSVPHRFARGFTLIELIIVMSIIALLAAIVLTSFTAYRNKAQDARRVSEMTSIQNAIELYYISHGKYPPGDADGCGGWDVGNADFPLFNGAGMEANFGGAVAPIDVFKNGDCAGYRYYLYPAGSYGCQPSRGNFYVLGVDMDAPEFPYPGSPGWSCPGRDWQQEFDWVAGAFEN